MSTREIACVPGAIPEEERASHFSLLRRLVSTAIERRRLPDGYLLLFSREAAENVDRFVINERRCCPFLEIAVTVDAIAGEVRLWITGPEGTPEFLEAEMGLQEGESLPTSREDPGTVGGSSGCSGENCC